MSGGSTYPVSTDRTPHVNQTDTRKHSSFEIPREAAGAIIGRGGSVLRELQQEFGCRVRIDSDNKADANANRKVLIWHDEESVHQAIRERIEHMVAADLSNNSNTIHQTSVDPEMVQDNDST